MSALDALGTSAAATHMDVELTVHRSAGDLDLILLLDAGFVDRAAAVRASVGQGGFVDLVDLRGRRAMGLGP
jgi:hypothetical protein